MKIYEFKERQKESILFVIIIIDRQIILFKAYLCKIKLNFRNELHDNYDYKLPETHKKNKIK